MPLGQGHASPGRCSRAFRKGQAASGKIPLLVEAFSRSICPPFLFPEPHTVDRSRSVCQHGRRFSSPGCGQDVSFARRQAGTIVQRSTMFRIECPYYDRVQELQNVVLSRTVRCPGCERFYPADRASATFLSGSETAEEQPRNERDQVSSVLTAPHCCQVVRCTQEIHRTIGRSRDTIVCPHCANLTSIDAGLHHCPSCWVLLESPLRNASSETDCPRCGCRRKSRPLCCPLL